MSIEIHPQLDTLLVARRMTAEDLARQIRARFDIAADATTIARLARQESLHSTNVELAVAAAHILGVRLDDLFRAADRAATETEPPIYFKGYSAEEVAALLDDHTYDDMAANAEDEVAALLAEYGRARYDHHLHAYAEEQGVTVEQAREVAAEDFAAFLRWQKDFEADAQRQDAVIERARKARAQRGE